MAPVDELLLLDELFSELSERADELFPELSEEPSGAGVLLLLCGIGAGLSFLHAANASVPQQRARESAKVSSFFIQAS